MRVRAMDANGDMTFGAGSANFLVDSPAAVAQSCQTRLALWQGEWFLDTLTGTPYSTQVLGENTRSLYDTAITTRILETPGMVSLASYQSEFDTSTRVLTIAAVGDTQYGLTQPIASNLIPPG